MFEEISDWDFLIVRDIVIKEQHKLVKKDRAAADRVAKAWLKFEHNYYESLPK